MNSEDKIAEWLSKVKFKRQIFGGVNEEDVWKKMQDLHLLFKEAIEVERIRYDTLLEDYKNNPDKCPMTGPPRIAEMDGDQGE